MPKPDTKMLNLTFQAARTVDLPTQEEPTKFATDRDKLIKEDSEKLDEDEVASPLKVGKIKEDDDELLPAISAKEEIER